MQSHLIRAHAVSQFCRAAVTVSASVPMQDSANELPDPATPRQTASGTRYGLSPSHHLQPPSPSRLRQETPLDGAALSSPGMQAASHSQDADAHHLQHERHQV